MCRASWSSGDLGLDRGSVSRSVHAKRVMRLMPPCHSAIMMHDAHHGCSSSSERSYHVHHQHITALEHVSRSRSVTRCDLICAARALRRASFTGDESPGVRGSATFFFFFFSIEWVERRGRPFYIACTGPMARLRVGVCFSRACVPGRAAGHDFGPKQKKRMER